MTAWQGIARFFFANDHFIRNPLTIKGLRGGAPRKSLTINALQQETENKKPPPASNR